MRINRVKRWLRASGTDADHAPQRHGKSVVSHTESHKNEGHFKVRGCPVVCEEGDGAFANDGTPTPDQGAYRRAETVCEFSCEKSCIAVFWARQSLGLTRTMPLRYTGRARFYMPNLVKTRATLRSVAVPLFVKKSTVLFQTTGQPRPGRASLSFRRSRRSARFQGFREAFLAASVPEQRRANPSVARSTSWAS